MEQDEFLMNLRRVPHLLVDCDINFLSLHHQATDLFRSVSAIIKLYGYLPKQISFTVYLLFGCCRIQMCLLDCYVRLMCDFLDCSIASFQTRSLHSASLASPQFRSTVLAHIEDDSLAVI